MKKGNNSNTIPQVSTQFNICFITMLEDVGALHFDAVTP